MSAEAAQYFEVTNGSIAPISAFAANKLDADDARAEGVADILGDLADKLRKVTANGFVMYGTKADALEGHNRSFTLGARVADNDNAKLAAGMKRDFAFAVSPAAAMAAPSMRRAFGYGLHAA